MCRCVDVSVKLINNQGGNSVARYGQHQLIGVLVMAISLRTTSNTVIRHALQLVVSDEKSSLFAHAKGDNYTRVKAEGRGLRHSNYQSTGRYARKGSKLDITVSPSVSGLEVVIGLHGQYINHNGGISATPVILALNPGANCIVAPVDGMIYIQNRNLDQGAAVEIYGGQPVPTFIKGISRRETFDAQVKAWSTAPFVELVGDYVLVSFQYATAVSNLTATPTDLDRRITMMDEVVIHMNAFCGLSNHAIDFAHKSSHYIYIVNPDTGAGGAYASPLYISFHNSGGLVKNLLVRPENNQWGLYHEVGHTYQMNEITWSGLVERSVNLYAVAVQEALGYPNYLDESTVYPAVMAFRETPIAERDFARITNGRLKVLMFDQLRRGFGAHFYAHLFQVIRRENVLGFPEPESDLAVQQHFMRTAGSVSNRNLTPFFEEWGLPIDDVTRTELARYPDLKVPIWNNFNRATDILELNLSPLEIPATLTAPAEGVTFDINHIPVYRGRGTPGALITIDEGAVSGGWNKVGTATVDDYGDWSFTGKKLPVGKREARAVQSNGGTGFARNGFTVISEIKKPVTLNSPVEEEFFDTRHAPVYRGRGTPGAWITIEQCKLDSPWYFVGKVVVDTNSDWACTGLPLSAGSREARAMQSTDGTIAKKVRFTVKDPLETPVTLTSPAEGDVFDINHAPLYKGAGTPGALITIQQSKPGSPWCLVGTTRVNTSGEWSYIGLSLPASIREARALQSTDGTVTKKATFTVMQEVKVAVTLTSPSNESSFNDSHPPLYKGKGTPGALITIEQGRLSSGWYLVGSATVNTQGHWSYTGIPLPVGRRKARALQNTDGTASVTNIFTVTPTAQVPVTLITPVEGDSFDESHIPVYSGAGTPGALIIIEQGPRGEAWKTVGITTVNADGEWVFTGLALTASERVARATQYINGVASMDRKNFVVVT